MKKTIYILFSILISITSGCQETFKDIDDPGWDNEDESTNVITIMSYNIKYCSPLNSTTPDVDAIAEVINGEKPDIVYIQEIDKNTTRSGKVDQLAELAKKTDMPFYYYAKSQDYQGGEFGIAFLSRYSLSDPQTIALSRIELEGQYVGYSVLAKAYITLNGNKVVLANTHLATTQDNRDLQIEDVIEILAAENYPIIFGGDLNATPDNRNISSLYNSGLKKTCLIGCNTIPSNTPNREIDYLMYTPESRFEIKSHSVITGTEASDHLPIVAVFELK